MLSLFISFEIFPSFPFKVITKWKSNEPKFPNNFLISFFFLLPLSLSDQIFLYELKNNEQLKYEELFIIHNLFNYETREDLEEYINNTIIHSIYFDLSKAYFDVEDESENIIDRPYYFIEEQENNVRKKIIVHLIIGNLNTEDKWIKNLNDQSIKYIKEEMQLRIAKDFFSIKFLSSSFTKKSYVIFREKHTLHDNEEFNVFGYSPDFLFYKDKKNQEFVIEIESAGEEDKTISITALEIRGKINFKIEEKKIFPKAFYIHFSVNTERENINLRLMKKIIAKIIHIKMEYIKKLLNIQKWLIYSIINKNICGIIKFVFILLFILIIKYN